MKISSLKNFKEAGTHVIPQNLVHAISGGTQTSSSTSEPTDPIPHSTTDTTPPPPPPPKETIYRIDGEFIYGM